MAKHERDGSPSNTTSSGDDIPSPSPSPKKAKNTKPAKPSPSKAVGSGSKTVWDAERSVGVLEAVFDVAAKAMDTQGIANALGVNKSQIVDQLKPNRRNLRRTAIELVRAKKGGA